MLLRDYDQLLIEPLFEKSWSHALPPESCTEERDEKRPQLCVAWPKVASSTLFTDIFRGQVLELIAPVECATASISTVTAAIEYPRMPFAVATSADQHPQLYVPQPKVASRVLFTEVLTDQNQELIAPLEHVESVTYQTSSIPEPDVDEWKTKIAAAREKFRAHSSRLRQALEEWDERVTEPMRVKFCSSVLPRQV